MSSRPTNAPAGSSQRVLGEGPHAYEICRQIGQGSFAVVWLGRHVTTGRQVAVKEVNTSRLNAKLLASLDSEVNILRNVKHENIIELFDIFKEPDKLYLVLEYCDGGDLSEMIKKGGKMSEEAAGHIMQQLGAGLRQLRNSNLVHRDLKPQNLLLKKKTTGDGSTLKIADFGFARYMQPLGLAETLCGSPLYMAPEILQFQKYDAKADLWSVGTILFEMLAGKPPYTGANHVQLLRNIERQVPPIAKISDGLSEDCVNLLRGLLKRRPLERMSFAEFFANPFVSGIESVDPLARSVEVDELVLPPLDQGHSRIQPQPFAQPTRAEKGKDLVVDEPNILESISLGGEASLGPSDRLAGIREQPPRVSSTDSLEREYVFVDTAFGQEDSGAGPISEDAPPHAAAPAKRADSHAGPGETSSVVPQHRKGQTRPVVSPLSIALRTAEAAENKTKREAEESEPFDEKVLFLRDTARALAYAADRFAERQQPDYALGCRHCQVETLYASWETFHGPGGQRMSGGPEGNVSATRAKEQRSPTATELTEDLQAALVEVGKMRSALSQKDASLPSDMTEAIYQLALELGRQGAVEEVLGNLANASDYYSHGAHLLRWLAGENGVMQLPIRLQRVKEDDCVRLVKYAAAIERRRARCDGSTGSV